MTFEIIIVAIAWAAPAVYLPFTWLTNMTAAEKARPVYSFFTCLVAAVLRPLCFLFRGGSDAKRVGRHSVQAVAVLVVAPYALSTLLVLMRALLDTEPTQKDGVALGVSFAMLVLAWMGELTWKKGVTLAVGASILLPIAGVL